MTPRADRLSGFRPDPVRQEVASSRSRSCLILSLHARLQQGLDPVCLPPLVVGDGPTVHGYEGIWGTRNPGKSKGEESRSERAFLRGVGMRSLPWPRAGAQSAAGVLRTVSCSTWKQRNDVNRRERAGHPPRGQTRPRPPGAIELPESVGPAGVDAQRCVTTPPTGLRTANLEAGLTDQKGSQAGMSTAGFQASGNHRPASRAAPIRAWTGSAQA